MMEGFVLIMAAVVFIVTGKIFDAQFEEKYSESALDKGWCMIQGIFVAGALLTLPGPDITGWFIFWCAGGVIAYIAGLSFCKQRAISMGAGTRDVKKIMAAQFLLPAGSALLFLIILIMIFGQKKRKKKKRK